MILAKMVRLWGWRSVSWRGRRVQHTPTSRWPSEKNTTTSRWSSKKNNNITMDHSVKAITNHRKVRKDFKDFKDLNAQFVAIVLVTILKKFSVSWILILRNFKRPPCKVSQSYLMTAHVRHQAVFSRIFNRHRFENNELEWLFRRYILRVSMTTS